MASREENESGRYAFLRNCTIEELEELLNVAMKDDSKDENYLSALESAILQREQENPTGRVADPDEAWKEFCSSYRAEDADRFSLSEELECQDNAHVASTEPDRRKPRRIGRVLLIAAVIVIFATLLLPPALGYRNIFHMIGQWTSSVFQFNTAPQDTNEQGPKNTELEESLAEYGISTEFAPTWFPEGMQMQDVRYGEQESGNTYYKAVFSDETHDREIFFDLIQYFRRNPLAWEKDTDDVIEFPCGGVTHYITTNNGQVSLHWSVDLTEVAIYGDMSVEEAEAIIQSIYER